MLCNQHNNIQQPIKVLHLVFFLLGVSLLTCTIIYLTESEKLELVVLLFKPCKNLTLTKIQTFLSLQSQWAD